MRDSKNLSDLTNEIPALQTEAEGKLRGGFSELTFEDIDLLATGNTGCSNNASCDGNKTCTNNGACYNNDSCTGNQPVSPMPKHSLANSETRTIDCSDLSSFGGSVLF